MIYDFTPHRCGDTWKGISSITISHNGVPVDLTESVVRIQFRSAHNVASPVVLELSSKKGQIVFAMPRNGVISIPSQNIEMPIGKYAYDLEVTLIDGTIKTYMEGVLEVIPQITR